MRLEHLKKVRVGVSILFFVWTAFLFLDFRGTFSPSLTNWVLYPQFLPSVLKYLNVFTLSAGGFVFIVLLTLVFGRVYCSTICPLGTLQDIITYISRKLHRKRYFSFSKPDDFLRYSLLLFAVLSLLNGSVLIANLLDPFSNFGRIVGTLVRPLVLWTNNAAAFTLEQFDLHYLYRIQTTWWDAVPLAMALLLFGLVSWLAFTRGRLYCNTVCPVGSLLGILSKYSLFQIVVEGDECKGCMLCEKVCKAGCIDRKNNTVDFSRCISCYNCFSACPRDGLTFRNLMAGRNRTERDGTDHGRREFILGAWVSVAGLAGVTQAGKKVIISVKPTINPVLPTRPVAPPGAISLDHFTSTCTACHLCVSACPTQVLVPSFLEYGFSGMLQPRMDYHAGFCNYECITCSQVCPSGALLPLAQEEKKLSQLGMAKFIKDNCIVFTEGTECGACSEHCPTKAVTMVPYKKLMAPEMRSEYCIGCGACEHACPTKPYKAIFVDGNAVHATAKKPEAKKLEEKLDYQGDFPF